MKTISAVVEAVQNLADEHADGAKGKEMDGVIAVFSSEDHWVDDEDDRSWQLAVIGDTQLNPYYWGVNA